jgi:hypothetical protein
MRGVVFPEPGQSALDHSRNCVRANEADSLSPAPWGRSTTVVSGKVLITARSLAPAVAA